MNCTRPRPLPVPTRTRTQTLTLTPIPIPTPTPMNDPLNDPATKGDYIHLPTPPASMPPGSIQPSPLAPASTGAPYTGTSNGAEDTMSVMVRDGMEWVRSHPLASILAVTGLGV